MMENIYGLIAMSDLEKARGVLEDKGLRKRLDEINERLVSVEEASSKILTRIGDFGSQDPFGELSVLHLLWEIKLSLHRFALAKADNRINLEKINDSELSDLVVDVCNELASRLRKDC